MGSKFWQLYASNKWCFIILGMKNVITEQPFCVILLSKIGYWREGLSGFSRELPGRLGPNGQLQAVHGSFSVAPGSKIRRDDPIKMCVFTIWGLNNMHASQAQSVDGYSMMLTCPWWRGSRGHEENCLRWCRRALYEPLNSRGVWGFIADRCS